jgi:hypothetical protein
MLASKFEARSTKHEAQSTVSNMLRAVVTILGIVLAAFGGVMLYRALFVEPASAVVITNEGVRQLQDTSRVLGGLALLVLGAALAFTTALRKRT